MLSNERTSAGASTTRRPNPRRDGKSSLSPVVESTAPGSVSASDRGTSIDAEGWEYIDVMLSRLMKG